MSESKDPFTLNDKLVAWIHATADFFSALEMKPDDPPTHSHTLEIDFESQVVHIIEPRRLALTEAEIDAEIERAWVECQRARDAYFASKQPPASV